MPSKKLVKFASIILVALGIFLLSKQLIKVSRKLDKVSDQFQKYRQACIILVANDDDGYPVFLNPQDTTITKEFLLSGGSWEPHVRQAIRNVIKPGQNVVVLGSHVGVHLMLISRLVGDTGKIYAFEPNVETLKFLKQNIANDPVKNITLYEKAAYSSNKKLKFFAANQDHNPGASYIMTGETHHYGGHEVEVDGVALDTVLPSDLSIDVIQMDVEGAEADAILGAQGIIDRSPNLVVIQEWTPKWMKKDVEKYLNFWRVRGYKFAQISINDLREMSDKDLAGSDQIDIIITKDLEALRKKMFDK